MSERQRRLAAIMFTDIVGYTSLIQDDESSTLQALEKHRNLIRPLFASHGGREIKTIGDAFLVEFPSALEAVLCAVAIQQMMHDRKVARGESLSIRIGIHVGDVIANGDDILGDAVNIASRIEPLAEPGGVCISGEVYSQVRNKSDIPFISLGKQSLKNVSTPVEVYRSEMRWEQPRKVEPPLPRNRIAILPFANMSPDPNDEYFADGMTEELITSLSGLQGLQVIARTSVMNYKKKEKNVSEIGKELSVGTVLEGSVRKSGNKVRVTAQLIDVPTESHLWSEKYDRELDDIFRIQDDIAGKIAEALRVKFATAGGQARERTENIEAYTAYLKGRNLWNRRDKEGLMESLRLFQEAIQMDPGYARAYTGLADAYTIAARYGFMDRADGLARSKVAIVKALELDNGLAEAHASLGLSYYDENKYEEALAELQRAIEINPNYASAHHWRSQTLLDFGREKEAVEEIEMARELDPLSPAIIISLATQYLYLERVDEAIVVLDRLIEREPALAGAYACRCPCFILKGMKERAYADAEAFYRIEKNHDRARVLLPFVYASFGERERALPMIEELGQRALSQGARYSLLEEAIAEWYATFGAADEFFVWIERAVSAKRISPSHVRYCFGFDKVRADPHFPEIFKKLGLPYQPVVS